MVVRRERILPVNSGYVIIYSGAFEIWKTGGPLLRGCKKAVMNVWEGRRKR